MSWEELKQLFSNRALVAARLTCEMIADFHDDGGRGEGRGHTPVNTMFIDTHLGGLSSTEQVLTSSQCDGRRADPSNTTASHHKPHS